MHLDTGGRWSLHTCVVGCIGAGAIMVFPTHPEIGWTLIAIGLLTSLLVELNQRWPGPLEMLAGRAIPRLALRRGAAFIPLAQAARELYEANLEKNIGQYARFDWRAGIDPLLWCAYLMASRGLTVYGRRPPSTVLEIVPTDVFQAGALADGAQRIRRDGFDQYEDLVVKRSEVDAVIADLAQSDWKGA